MHQNTSKQQRIIGLVMLSLTAVFWGAGFVLNGQLLNASFADTPNLLNAIRFVTSAVVLLAIFAKKLKCNKTVLLYGAIGGAMLFAGFTLQLIGLKYTTPSHNGFFTAAYIIFVPFIAWMISRKRPSYTMFVGVAIAIVGLVILNLFGEEGSNTNSVTGDLLTLAGSLMFALQIALSDYVLSKDKADHVNLTFWQVLFAAALFVLYTVIFESRHYASMHFDVSYNLWRLAVVSLGGTAFAYFAQSYAQNHLNPTETAIILACESPIGAALSILIGVEAFYWNTLVGGLLVIIAVVLMEIIPLAHVKRRTRSSADAQNAEKDESASTPENNADEPDDKI